jgi:molybdate transport system ATP-binding protein
MAERIEHRLAVKARVGALGLDVAAEFTAPWTVLFGPSGCGKTSVLRAMGGVLVGAEVEFGRRKLVGVRDSVETRGSVETHVSKARHGAPGFVGSQSADGWEELGGLAPDCRGLAYAPQAGAVFPHLSVRENVGFPYLVCKDPPREAAMVDEALSLFQLHALAGRRPGELSGGERQRVNLARAFATPHACLVMLDEPFAGLDRGMRDELLPRMMEWVRERGVPVVSVTHDVDEALLLAAEVVRMEAGKVVAQGGVREVLEEERVRMVRVLEG